GRLRADTTTADVLCAAFPPGSVTGAPKIRAMQIIDELEAPRRRGPYCGSIGFFSDCGAFTLNVAIRTMLVSGERADDTCDVIENGEISYSAGAGIVADSNPAREQQEALDKTAVLRGLSAARTPAEAGRRSPGRSLPWFAPMKPDS
ncbi:MAG TPA: chorismate-binding protein, partial [Roseiflexaceae bacterium]|nr:chorismate-binding protein [Roseiflexaceae bacterium]